MINVLLLLLNVLILKLCVNGLQLRLNRSPPLRFCQLGSAGQRIGAAFGEATVLFNVCASRRRRLLSRGGVAGFTLPAAATRRGLFDDDGAVFIRRTNVPRGATWLV